jgi:hypothetical protein
MCRIRATALQVEIKRWGHPVIRPPDNNMTKPAINDRDHRGSSRPSGTSPHRQKNGWTGNRLLPRVKGWTDSWERCGFRRSCRYRKDSCGMRCCYHRTGWSDSSVRCGFRRSCRCRKDSCGMRYCYHRTGWSDSSVRCGFRRSCRCKTDSIGMRCFHYMLEWSDSYVVHYCW